MPADGEVDQNSKSINLIDLPIEVLLYICSFLDASTLVHGLSLTCKRIHCILNDDSIWRSRISKLWPNVVYPVLPYVSESNELFWKLSCVSIEKQSKLWRETEALEKMWLSNIHYGTIDGLLLTNKGNICISGGRDRCLAMSKVCCERIEASSVANAHNGWIWGLTAIDDSVFSCSWDETAKAWSMHNGGLIPVTTFDMKGVGALLCMDSSPELHLFAAGSFCKKVLVYDPRSGESPISVYKSHNKAIIRVAMNSYYILSASEDKTVSIWDQRARQTLQTVTISKDAFPSSLCMKEDIVYVGDSSAKLHILDPKKNFEHVKIIKTDHEKSITGVCADYGCLITSSLDRTVRVSSPTDPLQLLAALEFKNGEIARICYLNEVLAVSGTDAIEIWRPKGRAKCS